LQTISIILTMKYYAFSFILGCLFNTPGFFCVSELCYKKTHSAHVFLASVVFFWAGGGRVVAHRLASFLGNSP
jgi:prolipoprotein diacylglyceryltransferase